MTQRRMLTALLVAAALTATATACTAPSPAATRTPTASATAAHSGPALPPGLTTSALQALPSAEFDAVIPGLLAAPTATPKIDATYRMTFDTAVYGSDFRTPVARIPAKNFLGEPTVIVRIETRGDWSLILTPARQQLPSKATAEAPAPAQSAAWVPTSALTKAGAVDKRVRISTSKQTLSILDAKGAAVSTFPVGVGTAETPTPTGVTGYLQARYHDPEQGQTEHRIQLTSLHATAADEPYGGSDGGLIGIHYQATATGAVSHGCVRLSSDAIAAVDALPLGTPVEVTD